MHSRFLASTLHAVAGSSEERPAAESPLAQTLLISKSHFILDLGSKGPRIRRWLEEARGLRKEEAKWTARSPIFPRA
ncbi:hypothetical protein AGR3A_Cc150045 [Agrobacterium tomkonis CFBP 6623]|uniref:Uncharacterized protein n=1 Tax=Agrobacterium tomkonis CFBP 6623 TaxID=1183432 RepID=A0A1S7NPZ4_9HYPH|nr:hypothetical protein AGR3A_Cc150045 [Agrobacterium tomkonis CFBP 6623]